MGGVSCVSESKSASDSVWGSNSCYVGFSRSHEISPELDGIVMSQNHTLDWMNAHKVNQTVKKELAF